MEYIKVVHENTCNFQLIKKEYSRNAKKKQTKTKIKIKNSYMYTCALNRNQDVIIHFTFAR